MIVIGYDLVSYLLHYPSARCVTFKELFVCKSSYLIRDFDINSQIFIPSFIRFFRKSGIIRRHTIAQNEFGTNVCQLPHSRRKGHCLTPKRCLDRWSNAPFFCAYAKRCFYGFSNDFSFFAVSFAGSGKWMQSVSACPMNETGSHTQRAIREEWLLSPGWTSPVGSENNHTSFVVVCPFHASGDVFFLLVIPFLRIFPWSFFYPISLCFRLPPFLRLSVSRIRQSFPFWAQR